MKKLLNGIILIELMLTIAISLLVVSYIVEIYLATESSHDTQIALNTIRNNALISTRLLRSAIHMAGYSGCFRLVEPFSFVKDKISSGSHSLTIRHLSSESAKLIKSISGSDMLYLSGPLTISKNDIIFISDCKIVDKFIVKEAISLNKTIQKIQIDKLLTNHYAMNAEARRFDVDTYFIATTDRKDPHGIPIKALYFQKNNQPKIEYVEGIDDMQIAIDVNNMQLPIGASIKLTLTSLNHFSLTKNWFIYAATYN